MKHVFSLFVLLPLTLFFFVVACVFVWNMFFAAPLLGKIIIAVGLPIVVFLALPGYTPPTTEEGGDEE